MQNDQTPQPAPTHIVLPLRMRDAMIQQLGQFPFSQVEEIVNILRQAPGITITQAQPVAKDNGQRAAVPKGKRKV